MAAEQVAATVVQGVGGHSQGVLGFMCCVCWVGGSKMYTQSSRYLCSPSLKKKALTGVQSVQKRRKPTPSAPHEFADSAPGREGEAEAKAEAVAVAVAELMCSSLCSTCQPMSAEMSSTPDYENDSPGGVEPHACASGAPLRGSGLDLFLAPERQLSRSGMTK